MGDENRRASVGAPSSAASVASGAADCWACLTHHPSPITHHLQESLPWQCLYFFPEPQGHGSFRPILPIARLNGAGAAGRASSPVAAVASASSYEACWYCTFAPAGAACSTRTPSPG